MGTNYYFVTQNSKFVHKYFANENEDKTYCWDKEYEIGEYPQLHYVIHLNKCSYGWRPLFQIHKSWSSFKELEDFYNKHKRDIKIRDEYGEEFTWDMYKEIILKHSQVTPQPMKWIYDKYLHTIKCSPDEADLWTPFNHIEYAKTEQKAAKKYNVQSHSDYSFYSHNDPIYMIDWVKGEFS